MFNDIDVLCELGKKKYTLMQTDPLRFFVKACMAGAYLGVATILSYTLGAMLMDFGAISKIAVAATYGIGLVAIVFLGAELFTGNTFVTIIPVFRKELRLRDIMPMWILCYIGNIIGISIVCFLFIKSGAQATILPHYLEKVVNTKLQFQGSELFVRAILCNFIVCLSSYTGVKVKSEPTRLIMIMLFVMTFCVAGLDHCIANAGVFVMGMAQLGTAIDWSSFPLHMILSTVGNMIGGSVMLAVPVYIMFRTPQLKESE